MNDARTIHRPTDRASLEREALKLFALGLSCSDIACALGVNVAVAKSFLAPVFSGPNTVKTTEGQSL
jgi:DNA-binding CsgD family transcriptional regulator